MCPGLPMLLSSFSTENEKFSLLTILRECVFRGPFPLKLKDQSKHTKKRIQNMFMVSPMVDLKKEGTVLFHLDPYHIQAS